MAFIVRLTRQNNSEGTSCPNQLSQVVLGYMPEEALASAAALYVSEQRAVE
jgi:hypothetical protein